jgi:hypothetical protein
MSIINAKNFNTSRLSNAMPNVAEAIMELLRPVIATVIEKQQIAGRTEEIPINITTKASIQPLKAQDLDIRTEGQRSWKYYTIFALSNLNVKPDNIFIIHGVTYRVLSKADWKEYGFIRYDTIEDYQWTAKTEDA